MNPRILFLVALAAATTRGEEPKPDPGLILKRAVIANRSFHSASFDLIREMVDAKGQPIDGARSAIQVSFRRGPLGANEAFDPRKVPFRFRAKGRWLWTFAANGEEEVELAFDGKTLRVQAPGRFVETPLAEAGVNFWEMTESSVLPQALADPDFVGGAPDARHEYLGTEQAGGVACHVIESVFAIVKCLPAGVDPKDAGFELVDGDKASPGPQAEGKKKDGFVCYRVKAKIRHWIGAKDYLVRRMRLRIAGVPGAPGNGAWMLETYAKLSVNVEIPEGRFTLSPRAGDRIERIAVADTQAMFGGPKLLSDRMSKELRGQDALEWLLKDASGKEHRLSDYRGKVVVLDFWGSWCPPCVAALPSVQAIHEEFKNTGKVVVFGVACKERDADAPQRVMKEKSCTYALLLHGDDVARQYRVRGFPTLLVLGPDGKVAYTEVGLESEKAPIDAIRKILAGKQKK